MRGNTATAAGETLERNWPFSFIPKLEANFSKHEPAFSQGKASHMADQNGPESDGLPDEEEISDDEEAAKKSLVQKKLPEPPAKPGAAADYPSEDVSIPLLNLPDGKKATFKAKYKCESRSEYKLRQYMAAGQVGK